MRKILNYFVIILSLLSILSCNNTTKDNKKLDTSTGEKYEFIRGFPVNEETIKKAQDASDLRRATEAYKYFSPTVETEAVMQQFQPHGAVANKVGIIMPQDPEQQFSVANQDTPYIISSSWRNNYSSTSTHKYDRKWRFIVHAANAFPL